MTEVRWRRAIIPAVAAITLISAGSAHADSIPTADGDIAAMATSNIVVSGCQLPVSRDGLVTVKRNGNDHLTPGQAFTLVATVTGANSANVSTVRTDTAVVPTTYDQNGQDGFTVPIRTTIGAAVETGSATVSVKVTQPGYTTMSPTSFTVTWDCVSNTKPTVTLGGVTHGSTYDFGAVPTPTCGWTDAEDGSGSGTLTTSPLSGPRAAEGLASRTATCSYTDKGGLTASASSTYVVADLSGPVVAAHADVTAEATGNDGAPVTFTAPTANDAVDGARPVTCLPESGSTFPLGATTVSCTAKDATGNTSAASTFTVTVSDTTAPAVTVPADETVEATGPDGAAFTYQASASDVVDGDLTPTCTPASGSTFPLGATTVSCSATDKAGHTGSESFVVTVQDSTAPEVTVPANITEEATGPDGAAASWPAATASDEVDGDLDVSCDRTSGSTFALGDTTVTCTATDSSGNEGSATFTVSVEDTTAPAVTVPADITKEATSPHGAVVTWTSSATDVVDGSVGTTCDPVSGTQFGVDSPTTVTCTATDAAGNTASESFTVTVQDTTPPALPELEDITLEASGPSGALGTYEVGTAIDLVDGDVLVTCDPASGSTFALGATTVTCTASDVHGNKASDTFSVTVQDTTDPVFSPYQLDAVEATSAAGAAVEFTLPTATDIVDTDVTVTCDHESGDVFHLGSTTVTCTATDDAGNSTELPFIVNVVDTTEPIVGTPANQVVEATGPSGATVTWGALTAEDAVDGTITDVDCVPPSGSTFPLDTTDVECSAADAAGNIGSAGFTVTVRDTTAPSFAPASSIAATATSASGAVVTYTKPVATDLVSGTTPVTCSVPSGSTFALGQTTVECTSEDAAGNKASTSFLVTVSVAWSGVLQPVVDGGTYKLGSTIPVKFQLTGASAGVTDLKATLWVRKTPAAAGGTATQAVSTSAATTGNLFRHSDGQYIFNLATKPLSAGTYDLVIDLGDGVDHVVRITLR